MEKLEIKEIVKAVKGELITKNKDTENLEIENITISSKNIIKNDLFIALKGDNFDGHDFIDDVVSKGAKCVISEKKINIDVTLILVSSTHEALRDLAEYYRSLFDVKVIAVTGSVGKTTTKDIIASILSKKYKVLKTEGNFNNEIGLPLTVFKINMHHEYVVLEMGMNHVGEIHNLSKIARPNIAVITNIGTAHIENLGTKNNIKQAKLEIFDYMNENSIAVLNGDDELLKNEKINTTVKFGLDRTNDIYATNIVDDNIEKTSFTVNYKGQTFNAKLNVAGRHMVLNALAGIAIGLKLGLSKNEILKGLEDFQLTNMRMSIMNLKKYTIINDVYNASLESVKASVDVLKRCSTRKVIIFGDMFELGELSKELHKQVGQYIAKSGVDLVICIGDFSIYTFEELKKINTKTYYYKTKGKALINIKKMLKEQDTILVKASRGMEFEKIVFALSE